MPGPLTDAFAWVVVLVFALGAGLEYVSRGEGSRGRRLRSWLGPDRSRSLGRRVSALAWALFAGFWLVLSPYFAFGAKSYVEGILSILAVPACLYAGYLLLKGRDSLFVLSRAVAVMGVLYLPFETIPAFTIAGQQFPAPRRYLIEVVAAQTGFFMNLLGYHPELVTGPQGYENTYKFVTDDGQILLFSVVLQCTGLGSIAIFAGLIGAVKAPLQRKARALAIAVPVIYALNLVRTTFIGVSFGGQLLHIYPDVVLFLFGSEEVYKVSWFISDRIVSQLLAVVALVGVTYLVIRELPEVLTVVEDVLYMLTNEEHDLARALDLPRPPREQVGPVRADD